jgi:hypothetical protein
MHQNVKLQLNAIPVTKVEKRIFIFVSFRVSAAG